MRSGSSGAKHVADNNQKQLKIWGRANSVNVQKVLWCLRELDLGYERGIIPHKADVQFID